MILFTIFMLPFDYLWDVVGEKHQAIVFIYSLIIFLTIKWLFEMYIVSIYKRVMLNMNWVEKID